MKKNNRFKKTMISLAIIMVLTFSGIAVVLGESGGSNGSDAGGAGDGKNCSSCSCTYTQGADAIYGVRLSIINYENGYKLSNTTAIDIFASAEATNSYQKNNIYIIPNDNTNKYNRADMVYGTNYGAGSKIITQYTSNPSLSSVSWSQLGIKSASNMGWSGSGISFNYGSISSKISYSSFTETLFTTMQAEVNAFNNSGGTDPNLLKITNIIFDELNLKPIQKYTEEQLKTLYIAVEPVVAIPVKGTSNTTNSYRYFYGTITQLAYAFQEKNCTNENSGKWSLSNSLLKSVFNVLLYATPNCNTSADPKYCNPTNWLAVSSAPSGGDAIRKALTGEGAGSPTSHGIGYIWLGQLATAQIDGCDSSVGYLNDLYKNGTITKSSYKTYINQVINGTFELTDSSTGQVYKVTEPQSWELLQETNYNKYNGGYAACSNIPTGSQDCDAAISYINSNYYKGTDAYHTAVEQVRNGTFEYEVYINGKLTKVKIDKAYNDPDEYAMLIKSVYTKTGGEAKCEPLEDVCVLYNGNTVQIDDCTTGKTYFKDFEEEDAWLTCEIAYTKDGIIYSSDNTGHDAVETTNGGVVGNSEYCEVFCYEDFETSFPTSVYDVKAGQTFTWGSADGIFGTVRIRKKCSTQTYVEGVQGYQFKEWEKDYKQNEKDLVKYYMRKGAYEKAADSVRATGSSSYYTCDYKCLSTCGEAPNTYPCRCGYTGCKRYSGSASSSAQSESYTHSYLGTLSSSVSASSTTVYGYFSSSEAKQAAVESLKNSLLSSANSQYNNYAAKLNSESYLLERIKQCTNNIEYLYDTAIRFTFSEPVNSVYGTNTRNFSFDGELDVTGSYNKNNVDTSQCTEKPVYTYTCSGRGSNVTCTPSRKTVLDCTMVKWEINGTYTYRYPSDKFKWYTLKTNATLVNEENKGSEDEAFFYSVGFGIPTALSLTEGTYQLKVTVDNIGDKATITGAQQYNVDNGHFAPLANVVNTLNGSGYGFDYSCIYEVENDVFGNDCEYDDRGKLTANSPAYCDRRKDGSPSGTLVGIDITYRLVTLLSDGDTIDKAFPSIDGSGREPASNWKEIGEAELRNILDAGVYNNDQAMYEIMLDVNAIQQIRQDNETYFDAGKDPYTSYVDANNFQKVYCETGTGQRKYCASDFISKLYAGTGLNYRLLGTCLPTSNTKERAKYILQNGCDTFYDYPNINWAR